MIDWRDPADEGEERLPAPAARLDVARLRIAAVSVIVISGSSSGDLGANPQPQKLEALDFRSAIQLQNERPGRQ